MKLILASNSPRRKELLAELGYTFEIVPSRFEERAEGLSARETALAFARGKAREVFSRYPGYTVLGADTVVALGGEIFGKPADGADARRMLLKLSGKTHSVFTGVCVCSPKGTRECIAETRVEFFPLGEELIERYIQSGLPADKAGAYGIQDGFPLVKAVEGSYTNVVGLPTEEVGAILSALGGETC